MFKLKEELFLVEVFLELELEEELLVFLVAIIKTPHVNYYTKNYIKKNIYCQVLLIKLFRFSSPFFIVLHRIYAFKDSKKSFLFSKIRLKIKSVLPFK